MGGGASSNSEGAAFLQEAEELLTCSLLLGRAVAALSFPDMYRIQDFHAQNAPELDSRRKTARAERDLFAMFDDMGEDGEDDGEAGSRLISAAKTEEDDERQRQIEEDYDYEDHFVVVVGNDKIVIDDVRFKNEDGWTPLHSCCHSHTAVSAGLAIIQQMSQTENCSFEQKTLRGPGTHNSGWSALHMASAYGVEPLVSQLLRAGANPNCRNSLDWAPLNEAAHRGFTEIIKALLQHNADVTHMPDEDATKRTPFVRPPPQSALGEAARCGFVDICKLLLDKGADKDQCNHIGWTPLHEAAFYNHAEAVKTLLVYGANAAKKNKQGALPFQLASLPSVRETIRDLGGEGAATDNACQSPFVFGAPSTFGSSTFGDDAYRNPFLIDFSSAVDSSSPFSFGDGAVGLTAPTATDEADNTSPSSASHRVSPSQERKPKLEPQSKETPPQDSSMLHSGSLLGDLPSLDSHVKQRRGADADLDSEASPKDFMARSSPQKGGRQKKGRKGPEVPADFPRELLCAIGGRPLKDAVQSPYGHFFERKLIDRWMRDNGSVCPITGQPLSAAQLVNAPHIQPAVDEWYAIRAKRMIAEQLDVESNAIGADAGPGGVAVGERASPTRESSGGGSCSTVDPTKTSPSAQGNAPGSSSRRWDAKPERTGAGADRAGAAAAGAQEDEAIYDF